jgi:exosome complex exonuclease DIS3/RRP44
VVREHYLRDDIACGALFCPTCDKSRAKLRETARNIVVIDTNVALHQVLHAGHCLRD